MALDLSPHIAVAGVGHEYKTRSRPLLALSNVDLTVPRGEYLSIIGPSGGGKSTLLKAIGGLLSPMFGRVTLDGRPPIESQRRKSIGFVFQEGALLPWRTVLGNVSLPLEVNTGAGDDAHDPAAVVDAVGLSDFGDYYPHQLSGGMKQRVALARALVSDPDILLMDEPLGALDEITRAEMRYELMRIWERASKTVVMVTHSVPEAVMMSDRVAVLSSRPGRLVGEVHVDLPRPRDEAMERDGRFLDTVERVKDLLSAGATDGRPALENIVGL